MTDFFSRHIENRAHAQSHGSATLWTYAEAGQALATLLHNGRFIFSNNRNNGGNGRGRGNSNNNRRSNNGGGHGNGHGHGTFVTSPAADRGTNQNRRSRQTGDDSSRRQLVSIFNNKTLCINWNKGLPCGGEVHPKDLFCTKPGTSDER